MVRDQLHSAAGRDSRRLPGGLQPRVEALPARVPGHRPADHARRLGDGAGAAGGRVAVPAGARRGGRRPGHAGRAAGRHTRRRARGTPGRHRVPGDQPALPHRQGPLRRGAVQVRAGAGGCGRQRRPRARSQGAVARAVRRVGRRARSGDAEAGGRADAARFLPGGSASGRARRHRPAARRGRPARQAGAHRPAGDGLLEPAGRRRPRPADHRPGAAVPEDRAGRAERHPGGSQLRDGAARGPLRDLPPGRVAGGPRGGSQPPPHPPAPRPVPGQRLSASARGVRLHELPRRARARHRLLRQRAYPGRQGAAGRVAVRPGLAGVPPVGGAHAPRALRGGRLLPVPRRPDHGEGRGEAQLRAVPDRARRLLRLPRDRLLRGTERARPVAGARQGQADPGLGVPLDPGSPRRSAPTRGCRPSSASPTTAPRADRAHRAGNPRDGHLPVGPRRRLRDGAAAGRRRRGARRGAGRVGRLHGLPPAPRQPGAGRRSPTRCGASSDPTSPASAPRPRRGGSTTGCAIPRATMPGRACPTCA